MMAIRLPLLVLVALRCGVNAAAQQSITPLSRLKERARSSFHIVGYCPSSSSPECESLSYLLGSADQVLELDGMVHTILLAEFNSSSQPYWQPKLCPHPALRGARLWFACHDGTSTHMVDLFVAVVGSGKASSSSSICLLGEAEAQHTTQLQRWWQQPAQPTPGESVDHGLACNTPAPGPGWPSSLAAAAAAAAEACGPNTAWYACPRVPLNIRMEVLLDTLAAAERHWGAKCIARQLRDLEPAAAAAAVPWLLPKTASPRDVAAITSTLIALARSPESTTAMEELRQILQRAAEERHRMYGSQQFDDWLKTIVLSVYLFLGIAFVALLAIAVVLVAKEKQEGIEQQDRVAGQVVRERVAAPVAAAGAAAPARVRPQRRAARAAVRAPSPPTTPRQPPYRPITADDEASSQPTAAAALDGAAACAAVLAGTHHWCSTGSDVEDARLMAATADLLQVLQLSPEQFATLCSAIQPAAERSTAGGGSTACTVGVAGNKQTAAAVAMVAALEQCTATCKAVKAARSQLTDEPRSKCSTLSMEGTPTICSGSSNNATSRRFIQGVGRLFGRHK